MSKRTKFLLGIGVIAALVLGMQVAAYANHYGVSLEGSKFEIENSLDPDGPRGPIAAPPGANLVVDVAGNEDWVSEDEIRVVDAINGTGDNSFGQGSKEDTTDPTVVDDGIPPNKSDLRNFGVYLETNAAGRFLHVFWHRVQDPSGTTNMDFEFNANVCGPDEDDVDEDGNTTEPNPETCSANGQTPQRLAGDVLIQYDLTNGGTRPELFLSEWVTAASAADDPDIPDSAGQACQASNSFPCWGDRINLSASGEATGSINNAAIVDAANTTVDETDGIATGGSISPRTFCEASINFDAIAGDDPCVGFGSAYLKSRSSDSFSAAMKDFTPPEALDFDNCGKIIIRKQTLPDKTETDPDPTFGYNTQNVATPATFTLQDDGVKTFDNVPLGSGKTVTENVIPTGWAFKTLDCSASTGVPENRADDPSTPENEAITNGYSISGATVTFQLDDASDILDCTYTNELRSTNIATDQSFIPQDKATITGLPTTGFTGTVEFRLFSGLTCSGTALYTDTGNTLSPQSSGGTAQTDNDGVPTADDGDAGYSIIEPGGDFSWEVKYVPAASGDVHPPQTYCHEDSRVTIDDDDTLAPNPLAGLTT